MKVSKQDLAHAKANNLHHYHIGLPKYRTPPGGGSLTSGVILHYQLLKDDEGFYVVIIGSGNHPPFELPEANRLHV